MNKYENIMFTSTSIINVSNNFLNFKKSTLKKRENLKKYCFILIKY